MTVSYIIRHNGLSTRAADDRRERVEGHVDGNKIVLEWAKDTSTCRLSILTKNGKGAFVDHMEGQFSLGWLENRQ